MANDRSHWRGDDERSRRWEGRDDPEGGYYQGEGGRYSPGRIFDDRYREAPGVDAARGGRDRDRWASGVRGYGDRGYADDGFAHAGSRHQDRWGSDDEDAWRRRDIGYRDRPMQPPEDEWEGARGGHAGWQGVERGHWSGRAWGDRQEPGREAWRGEAGRGGWQERSYPQQDDREDGRPRSRRWDERPRSWESSGRGGWTARGGFGGAYGGREDNERGLWDRATDELASWFGSEDASRRRQQDAWRDQHRGRGPRGYTRSDERIREDVNDRLTDDPMLDASDIEVSVGNGEVTLNGMVDGRHDKRRAEDVAEGVPGVTHVQNNLRVRQHAMTDRPRAGSGSAWQPERHHASGSGSNAGWQSERQQGSAISGGAMPQRADWHASDAARGGTGHAETRDMTARPGTAGFSSHEDNVQRSASAGSGSVTVAGSDRPAAAGPATADVSDGSASRDMSGDRTSSADSTPRSGRPGERTNQSGAAAVGTLAGSTSHTREA